MGISTQYIAGNGKPQVIAGKSPLNDENVDTFYYFLPNYVDGKTRIENFLTR